ncbi:hypothetical protein EXW94_02435 [Enterobacter sp. JMULE2]|nr:hypothetical protein [Enterobacter sp. JMULE2]
MLPGPEIYINYDLVRTTAMIITGNENAESMYDAYSFIDWVTMLIIIIPFYIITMNLLEKIRNK